jgi:hypothetical protein
VRVANGDIAGRLTRRISLVFALAGAVSALGIHASADDLDAQYPFCFLRLVFARARTTLASSRLDPVAGVRIGRGGRHRRLVSWAVQLQAWRSEFCTSTKRAEALKARRVTGPSAPDWVLRAKRATRRKGLVFPDRRAHPVLLMPALRWARG